MGCLDRLHLGKILGHVVMMSGHGVAPRIRRECRVEILQPILERSEREIQRLPVIVINIANIGDPRHVIAGFGPAIDGAREVGILAGDPRMIGRAIQ